MKKYGFEWPDHMNCDLFPEYGSTKEVCMDPMDQEQQNKKKLTINHNLNSNNNKNENKKKISSTSTVYKTSKSVAVVDENQKDSYLNTMCQKPFLKISKTTDSRYNKITSGGDLTNCIQPCKSIYFNEWQQLFSYYWLFIWTIICLASSLCTTFTFLIDSSRFKYPERPIIYLSICYLFVSFGYLIRFLVGHEKMACGPDSSAKYEINTLSNDGMNALTCYLSFIFIYFFGMASCVWWVVISLTWFLAAGLKWGTEAIAKFSNYFHLVSWGLPFIQTIIILIITRSVDADPLTGLCYVGNLNSQNLRLFVILPSVIYLTIGITFLIAGFISLFRIRNMIKQQNGDSVKAQKIEKLMLRIGVFSILYTVPATCVIACQFYEQYYRSDWEKNLLCKQAKLNPQNDASIIQEYCGLITERSSDFSESPEFLVFMIKHLMSLIVGITSGFWILSKKTACSWYIFMRKVFCCFSFKTKTNRNRKDSIVYFQANDDIENNPHNLLYDSNSSTQSSQKQHSQQQQQQLLLSNNSSSVYQSNLESNQNLIKPSNANTSGSIPETFECLHSNNNQVYQQNNLYLPQFNQYQIQNCHTNKAAAFYYDYSNSKNELTSVSSKYSFQSK